MKTTNSFSSVADNVWRIKDLIVNLYMIQNPENGDWVLVDTGLKTSYKKIRETAAALFDGKPPKAIILTHGHFDHTGSLKKLLSEWYVPVYAHYLEFPYLTGKSHYPPPDSSVGGGLMATIADVYPSKPINIESSLSALPEDGTVPFLQEWRYIHTPGHAPGHISLFREKDNVLIAGDAFVTTQQESAIAVILQKKKVCGPPAYFTYDWAAAADSVKKLKVLAPEIVATGHGKPMYGKAMRTALQNLHEHFDEKAVPSHGRYINDPAITDVNGLLYVPPATYNPLTKLIIASSIAVASLTAIALLTQQKRRKRFFIM